MIKYLIFIYLSSHKKTVKYVCNIISFSQFVLFLISTHNTQLIYNSIEVYKHTTKIFFEDRYLQL